MKSMKETFKIGNWNKVNVIFIRTLDRQEIELYNKNESVNLSVRGRIKRNYFQQRLLILDLIFKWKRVRATWTRLFRIFTRVLMVSKDPLSA